MDQTDSPDIFKRMKDTLNEFNNEMCIIYVDFNLIQNNFISYSYRDF